jgi:hypothetical protein
MMRAMGFAGFDTTKVSGHATVTHLTLISSCSEIHHIFRSRDHGLRKVLSLFTTSWLRRRTV